MESTATNLNPYAEAQELANKSWLNKGFPVDPVQIAASLGIDVFDVDMPKGVSGAIRKRDDGTVRIYLNRNDGENRKRFTVAHELGHYIYNNKTGEGFEYVDYRATLASEGTDAAEKFANMFAAELLMPISVISRHHRLGQSVADMADFFAVSKQSVRYRLDNIGLTG